MDNFDLNAISPHVRSLKIHKSTSISGSWIGYDNVFTYIEEGEADFILNGVTYRVSEGDIIMLPPFQHHIINATNKSPLIQYIFHFDLFYKASRAEWEDPEIQHEEQWEWLPEEMYFSQLAPICHNHHHDRLEIKKGFLVMYKEFTEKMDGYQWRIKSIALHLLTIFVRNQLCHAPKEGTLTKGWATLKKSIDLIQLNYHNPNLNNEQISQECSISSSHLSYLYKEQLGISVHKYLNFIRIEQAKKLIMDDKLSITEIAYEVGFSSVQHFCKTFKISTGIRPSQFLATFAKRLDQ